MDGDGHYSALTHEVGETHRAQRKREAMKPYFEDSESGIVIYHGDYRDVVSSLGPVDLILTDPPYGQTSLKWDRWPTGWCSCAEALLREAASLWCFGTLRMFMDHAEEFSGAGLVLAQDIASRSIDIIWEKHNGSSFHNDRFRRVHEQAAQFYRLHDWAVIYKNVQVTHDATARTMRRKSRPPHMGIIGESNYVSTDGGPRLMRSVLSVRSMHGKAQNATEKPTALIRPMMDYACRPGGLVLDMFCGSGPVLEVAMVTGRRAIGIDIREEQCEIAARRVMATPRSLFADLESATPEPVPEQINIDFKT